LPLVLLAVQVEFMDVYREITEVMRAHMGPGASFKAKKVTRNYAFEFADVPRQPHEYLKVVFSAKWVLEGVATVLSLLRPAAETLLLPARLSGFRCRPLPKERSSGRTFSHIFGTGTTPLEHFLLKRDLMGPSWLRLASAKQTPELSISYCRYDIAINDPKCVSRYGVPPKPPKAPAAGGAAATDAAAPAMPPDPALPTPPLVVLSIAMKTVVDPKKHVNEVAAVSLFCHRGVDADGPTDENPAEAGVVTAKTIVRPLNGEVC
jgi:DNA polymerase alpha subunit A